MMRIAATLLFVLVSAWASSPAGAGWRESPVVVEPAELARREDLVGKLVSVDDRIRFFQHHARVGYDELYLRRTPVPVRLPVALRPDTPPRNPAVVVEGRLTREGTRLYLDATAVSLQPPDLERLEKAVTALPSRDFEQRREWARWAIGRAKDFGDQELAARGKAIEAEALKIEGDARRTTVDAPREWLALARQGRRQGVAEPAPSALAHRALRALLATAATPSDLDALRAQVEEFFPSAAVVPNPKVEVMGRIAEDYAQDPAAAYRAATEGDRKALDRRLWGDVVQKSLELRAAADLQASLQVVDDATRLLPDRPDLASTLIARARDQASRDLGSVRLPELKVVGELLRDREKKPGEALSLYRDWLDYRRERLGDADAEASVALAAQYDALLNDAEAARRLLERAWKIAPGSAPVVEAFKLRGYHREGEDWVKDAPAVAVEFTPEPRADQGLRGKTPAEVRAELGVGPNSRSVTATRGRTVIQWTFDGPRQRRYVNFVHLPGGTSPRVVSDFFLPR